MNGLSHITKLSPFVFLLPSVLSNINSSNHFTLLYAGHYVCGDAVSDVIRTRALIDQENTELPVSRSNDFTSQQISGAFTQIDFSENSRTRKGSKNEE